MKLNRCTVDAAFLLMTLAVSACSHNGASGSSGSNSPPPPQTAAKVIVSPSSLLVQPGGSAQLTVQAFDANGALISNASITWTASSTVVTVDSDGKVTGGNAVDSAIVTASVGSIASAPVTVLVASVTAGAQLVTNDQVLSDPALLDTSHEPGVGSQLKFTFAGPAPAVGTIIVSAGDKPISGKVVSSTPNGANTDVVYEVTPLADVFSKLKLERTYAASELNQQFDVQPASKTQNADGTTTYQFAFDTPDPPAAAIRRQATSHHKVTRPAEILGSAKWTVGPFSCSAKSDLSAAVSFKNIASSVTPSFGPVDASININGGVLTAALTSKGTLKLVLDGELHLTDKLTDSLSCDARLFKYIVPVPPIVAVVFVPVVPVIGLRANVSGTLSVGDVVIGLKSEVLQPMTLAMTLGSDGTFTNNAALDPGATTSGFDWTLNTTHPGDQVQFHGDAHAGIYAQVAFTNGFLVAYTLFDGDYDPIKSLIDGFAGFHASVGLASTNAQIQDATTQTGYSLTALAEIKAGDSISTFVSFLSSLLKIKNIVLPDLKYEPTLFSSPVGNARASLRRFVAGDTEIFSVVLDPTTVDPMLLGNPIIPYNVKQVEIWRKIPGGQSEMVGMDVGEAGASGAPGKNTSTSSGRLTQQAPPRIRPPAVHRAISTRLWCRTSAKTSASALVLRSAGWACSNSAARTITKAA